MSKLADTNALVENYVKIAAAGLRIEDYNAVLLDIAQSLAIIADSLSKKEEEEEEEET